MEGTPQSGVEDRRRHGGDDLMECWDNLGTTDEDAVTEDGDTGGANEQISLRKTDGTGEGEVEPCH